MSTRYFAFGCSYVNSRWGTVADFIGANFDEYRNLGNAGSCNTFSCNRLIEADNIFNFNSETDFVTVGVTGFGRLSYVDKDENLWITPGDILIYNKDNPPNPNYPEKTKLLALHIDSYSYAVYRTWVSIKTISTVLKSKNIKHIIYPSIDNILYLTDYDLPNHTLKKVEEIFDMCDIKESIDEFIINNYPSRGIKYNDGSSDSHPTQLQHYEYLKKHFQNFNTEKTLKQYQYLESIFDYNSINTQTINMMKLFKNTHIIQDCNIWKP